MISLDSPLTSLPGIGDKMSQRLEKLELKTLKDLLGHYPSRYLDLTNPVTISELNDRQTSCFKAKLGEPKEFRSRSGKFITQIKASDPTGNITLTWFNSPYLARTIEPDSEYLIAGKPTLFGGKLSLISPQIEPVTNDPLHTKGLIPIYPQTEGVTSKWLRKEIKKALSLISIEDQIPSEILDRVNLPSLKTAYKEIHFPQDNTSKIDADKRLSFNEHLRINLTNLHEIEKLGPAATIKIDKQLHQQLNKRLPFELTPDQVTAIDKVYTTLSQAIPNHLLIQGDTGSGKTVISLFAAIQSLKNNYSFALLAPTLILANQHYQTFLKYFPSGSPIQLVTGTSALKHNITGPQIYIGTHALLNQLPEELAYPLNAIFIDEQHKFGVQQREILRQRTPVPHLVNMTATPIPRTLALGIFGDIKVISIKHKPRTRLPIKTWVISNKRFNNSKTWLTGELSKGSKVFVVCPFISSSDSQANIKSAQDTFQNYLKSYKPHTEILLIHGKMSDKQKEEVISAFNKAKSAILVSTPIIEVGIDIPEANIIIIHSAERFGLAQLHQLRGRVGRGDSQGYCLLIPSTDDQLDVERLQLLTRYNSGLTLAKLDLRLRGSGEFLGTRQHGRLYIRLKNYWNQKLYRLAHKIALELIETDPEKAATIASLLDN